MTARWSASVLVMALLVAVGVSLAFAKPTKTRTVTKTVVKTQIVSFDGYQASIKRFLHPTLARRFPMTQLKTKFECFQYGDKVGYRWMVIACTVKGVPVS